MSSTFPSLNPPQYDPNEKESNSFLDVESVEAQEKEYEQWLAGLQECPYPSVVGVRVSEFDETDLDMDESLEDSEVDDESLGVNEVGILHFEGDSDHMDESSLQDNAALTDST